MPKSVYVDYNESTPDVAELILNIVLFIESWVKIQRTTIPKKKILESMRMKGKSELQINHALNLLLKRKYIRKAITVSNKISYVQIGTIHIYDR